MLRSGDVGRLRSVATQVRIIPTSIYNTKPIVLFRVTRYTIELTEARSTPTLTEIERATKKKNSRIVFLLSFFVCRDSDYDSARVLFSLYELR